VAEGVSSLTPWSAAVPEALTGRNIVSSPIAGWEAVGGRASYPPAACEVQRLGTAGLISPAIHPRTEERSLLRRGMWRQPAHTPLWHYPCSIYPPYRSNYNSPAAPKHGFAPAAPTHESRERSDGRGGTHGWRGDLDQVGSGGVRPANHPIPGGGRDLPPGRKRQESTWSSHRRGPSVTLIWRQLRHQSRKVSARRSAGPSPRDMVPGAVSDDAPKEAFGLEVRS